MGIHGEPTSFIYRHLPKMVVPPLDVQRKIIDWSKRGIALESICRVTGYFLPTVKAIADRGVVFLTETDEPTRCHECGARLKASPCLRCELLTTVFIESRR